MFCIHNTHRKFYCIPCCKILWVTVAMEINHFVLFLKNICRISWYGLSATWQKIIPWMQIQPSFFRIETLSYVLLIPDLTYILCKINLDRKVKINYLTFIYNNFVEIWIRLKQISQYVNQFSFCSSSVFSWMVSCWWLIEILSSHCLMFCMPTTI